MELTETDAIIHGRMDERESYVVLEWPNGKLHVRASTSGEDEGRALAVAGLYEIEELVAEEASPLPPDKRQAGREVAHSNGNGQANGNGHKSTLNGAKGTSTPPAAEAPVAPSATPAPNDAGMRSLTLALSVNDLGLYCEAFWVKKAEKRGASAEKQAAFGKAAEGLDLTGPEREKMIRLASLARRAGFHFQSARACYVMEEWDKAPGFLRNELKNWHNYFTVDVDPAVNALTRGLRDTELTGRAIAKGRGRLAFHWDLRVGDEWLTPEEARRLLRRGPGTSFIAGRGLVRLPTDQAEILADWHHVLDKRMSGGLPNYMLLSAFAREAGHVQVSPELQAWKDALFKPDWSIDGLPPFLRPYQAARRDGC